MDIRLELPPEPEILEALLLGLCAVNARMLVDVDAPPVYTSGVIYQEEPPRSEDWWTFEQVIAHGWGDCEDLVCWRVAELWKLGETGARPRVYRSSGRKLHTVVERDDGSIEDPSRILGMGLHHGDPVHGAAQW